MANPELMTGLGAALSIFLSSAGTCFASVPAGVFALRSSGIRAFFPIVIAGVLAIYGIIVSVILASRFPRGGESLTEEDGYRYLSAGLAVGLACLASGLGMARFLRAHGSMTAQATSPDRRDGEATEAEQPLLTAEVTQLVGGSSFVTFTMVLVFLEAVGLYGLIVALCLMGN